MVVKPISSAVRRHIDKSYSQYKSRPFAEDFLHEGSDFLHEGSDFVTEKRRTTENDDYEFLDENEIIEDEEVMSRNDDFRDLSRKKSQFSSRYRRRQQQRRPRRQKRDVNSEYHVIFKRSDDNLKHSSDYGKISTDVHNTSRYLNIP